jgi:hypothetical protein
MQCGVRIVGVRICACERERPVNLAYEDDTMVYTDFGMHRRGVLQGVKFCGFVPADALFRSINLSAVKYSNITQCHEMYLIFHHFIKNKQDLNIT